MADTATASDWESHFSALGGNSTPPSLSSTNDTDWASHFAALAPSTSAPAPPPQLSGWTRKPLLAAKALGQGVMNLLDLPGDAINSVIGAPKVQAPGVFSLPPIAGLTLSPSSTTDSAHVSSALGLTGTPQLTPQGPVERYGSAAVEALPAAGAAILFGVGAVPSLLAALGGAVAGEATHDLMPGNKWAPVVAGTLAGLGFGGVSGWVGKSLEARAAAKALTDAESQLDQASDAQFYGKKSAADAAADIKSASQAKLQAAKQLTGQVVAQGAKEASDHFETTAAGLGSSTTLQQAGTAMQDGARSWLTDTTPGASSLPNKLSAAWSPVDSAVPKDLQLGLPEFHTALGAINSSAGELEPVAAFFKSRVPASVGKAFDKILNPEASPEEQLGELTSESGEPTEEEPKTFSWGDVQKLRSAIGDAMSNPQTVRDLGSQNMAQLYRALTTDMRVGADSVDATALFDSANEESSRLYQIAEGPVAKLVAGARPTADDPLPENVASSLLAGGRRGATDLTTLRAEMPGAVDELAAGALRQPGAWSKLAQASKVQLVGDSGTASGLDSVLDRQAQVQAQGREADALAHQNHADTVSAASRAAVDGNFSRAEAVRNAQKAVDEARSKLPPPSRPMVNAAHSVQSSVGALIGYDTAPMILQHLGVNPSIGGQLAVAGAGLALPLLARASASMIRNPGNLLAPLAGAAAANNPLSVEPTSQH